jgi:hypothetical protein
MKLILKTIFFVSLFNLSIEAAEMPNGNQKPGYTRIGYGWGLNLPQDNVDRITKNMERHEKKMRGYNRLANFAIGAFVVVGILYNSTSIFPPNEELSHLREELSRSHEEFNLLYKETSRLHREFIRSHEEFNLLNEESSRLREESSHLREELNDLHSDLRKDIFKNHLTDNTDVNNPE